MHWRLQGQGAHIYQPFVSFDDVYLKTSGMTDYIKVFSLGIVQLQTPDCYDDYHVIKYSVAVGRPIALLEQTSHIRGQGSAITGSF